MGISTVAFLTSSHSPFDDRIFYHQAKSLSSDFKVAHYFECIENHLNTRLDDISILMQQQLLAQTRKRKLNFLSQAR